MSEFKLDPHTTALVFIDLQNGIVGMNPAPHSAAEGIENSKKLAEAARAKALPVFYVGVDINDMIKLETDAPSRMGPGPFPAELSEIAESAAMQPGDLLITK